MKTKLTILALIGVTALAFADEQTGAGHFTARHALTLEGAKKAGEAAMKFAKENGVGPSIGHKVAAEVRRRSFSRGCSCAPASSRRRLRPLRPIRLVDTIGFG